MPLFPMDLKLVLAATLAATLVPFFLIWLVSVRMRDVSIVDIYWGPGFVLVAAVAIMAGGPSTPSLILLAAVTAWALRLGAHIGIRKLGESHEDARYAAMRRKAGDAFVGQSLVWVFGLQAVLQWLVAMPIIFALAAPSRFMDVVFYAGLAVFIVGLTIEAIGDWQLRRFMKTRGGPDQVNDRGLWAWSRHPNYFGESTLWWGLFLMAFAIGAPWWTAASPALMTFMLLRVSGVTMLEHGLKKRKPAYADYARRTSAFIPWPPKRREA
ncbi:hypothetical protein sos41_22540 [Alphaproteobacteria bacterium SO-S41]|nr:hypothetical protein sos41_22540 [Alphaproteobacteria bacterium SO-S41]